MATKCLFLFTAYPLWSETFLRQDLAFLQRTGLDVEAAALYHGDCDLQPGWPQATVLSPDATTNSTAQRGRLAALKRLLPAALRTALSLHTHHTLLQALEQHVLTRGFGHLHAEFADLAALLAAQVARRHGLSFSVGIHAFDVHATKYDPRAIFSGARFVTACNQAAFDACLARMPDLHGRLHLIYHGVNLDRWRCAQTLPGADGPPTAPELLFVGRLVPKKGLDILLRALASLVQRGLSPRLTLVGSGPLEAPLRRLADELGLAGRLSWRGVLAADDIRALMPAMTCLCAPSVVTPDGDRDGIPNVILEAMAAGLPVIASQVGSIAEAVTTTTGWPLPTLTPETLADAIADAAAHPEQRDLRRQHARRLVEQRFDAATLARLRRQLFPA
ncbi:MAG: glycosyltransferase family 4 protein [Oligosphaeraceae bacterium]